MSGILDQYHDTENRELITVVTVLAVACSTSALIWSGSGALRAGSFLSAACTTCMEKGEG